MLIIGPCVAEAVKIAPIMALVETRPFLIQRSLQIWTAAVASAVFFAVVCSAVGVGFTPTRSLGWVLFRWIGSTGLHVGCTVIAASGTATAWQEADRQVRMPKIGDATGALMLAIILHAGFNALTFFWGAKGYTF
ncbi:MAG: hypothetical protein JXQ75_02365 [Phycisphaerae bacterium]|nr:hypothetical protein [Phycisphaerae bacterium]